MFTDGTRLLIQYQTCRRKRGVAIPQNSNCWLQSALPPALLSYISGIDQKASR